MFREKVTELNIEGGKILEDQIKFEISSFSEKIKYRIDLVKKWLSFRKEDEKDANEVLESLDLFNKLNGLIVDLFSLRFTRLSRISTLLLTLFTSDLNSQTPSLKFDNPQRWAYENFENFKKYVALNNDPERERNENEELKKIRERMEISRQVVENRKNDNSEMGRSIYNIAISNIRLSSLYIQLLEKNTLKNSLPKNITKEQFEEIKKEFDGYSKEEFKAIDEVREYLLKILSSESYKRKALNEGLNEYDVNGRIGKVIQDKTRFEDGFNRIPPISRGTMGRTIAGVYSPLNIRKAFGSTPGGITLSKNRSILPKREISIQAAHEIGHSITNSIDDDLRISEKAIGIYSKSITDEKFENKEYLKYLSSYSEIDARRIAFQYEIQKLGLWKYDEKFTEEKYNKILKMSKEGKLSDDSALFLKYIKKDYLIMMMNELASNLNGLKKDIDA